MRDVSFDLDHGATLGLVGESGCGKTTIGRAILRLIEPTSGRILFEGKETGAINRRQRHAMRRAMQIVFQDPAGALNPRMRIGDIVAEPMTIHGIGDSKQDRRDRAAALLERCGVHTDSMRRRPHEFSGGQRQRIVIARALTLSPRLLVCDEPTSSLDVSVQSQILNLLVELQRNLGLSYLFIAHDLAVVKHISDRVAVMYLGKLVEVAGAEEIYQNPRHAYTKTLLAAVPIPDPTVKRERHPVKGDVPSPLNPPAGSAFGHRINHPRYEETVGMDLGLVEIEPGHWVARDPCCLTEEDWELVKGT